MKRTGRCPLNFLRMLRQSIEKMSKPTSQLARCSTIYRKGRSRNKGICTFRLAILSTTPLSDLNGESRIKALTSYAQVLANMMAQRLPILLPQIVIRPTFTCFLTSSSMSRISKTSFTPQLRSAGSLLPQPKRSKAVRLKPNCPTRSASGTAYSLEPPLPCRQRMVSVASTSGEWNKKPSIFFPFLLSTVRSFLRTECAPTCFSLGPSAVTLQRICGGAMMFLQASSKTFILYLNKSAKKPRKMMKKHSKKE